MPRREETWLREMLDAVRAVAEYIDGHTFDSFVADKKTSDAVVFQMMILGEAAKSISETTCQKHPQVAWRSLKRTRDTVVHAYFSIDYPFVWKSATENFPTLRVQLEHILEAEYGTKN